MLLAISVPADNLRGPQYTEQLFAVLHQANPDHLPFELLVASPSSAVTLLCRMPPELAATFETQFAAHYPDATLRHLPDAALAPPPGSQTWSCELQLRPELFPIRRYAQFEDPLNRTAADPLSAVFSAVLLPKNSPMRAAVTLQTRPAAYRRVERARRAARMLASPGFSRHPRLAHSFAVLATSRRLAARLTARLLALLIARGSPSDRATAAGTRSHDREDPLQAAHDKLARHLFDVRIRLTVSAPAKQTKRAHYQLRRLAGSFGQFTLPATAAFRSTPARSRPLRRAPSSLLSCEELATLWHPATATVRAEAMQVTESREREPPLGLPTPQTDPGIAVLGRVKFRSSREKFGIRPDDRRRHLAIIGKTGMGKTTLLHHLMASDVRSGHGLALLDPHGDLADALLAAIPSHRTNDVVLFDASDRQFPPSYNPLHCPHPEQRGLVASGVVSAFKKLYGDSWGPRLEHILRNGLLALLELPGTSLVSLQRLLADGQFRRSVADRLADPVVRAFWQREFAGWKPQYQAEAIAPIQNKLGQFLSQPTLRAIVGQNRAVVDLRRIMDDGHVLIVNLSKGKIGEDACTLLGSLLVTGLQLAAMSRADVSEDQRRDFHLYVDEFQNFATDSFATILSEARKYRLTLTIANQYLAQMDESTMAAVFGNVGSLLSFQVGAQDAEILAQQIGGDLLPRDLLTLPRYRAYARLLVDGMPSRPFSMETMPPPPPPADPARAAIIRRTSRHRYARPAGCVEEELRAAFA